MNIIRKFALAALILPLPTLAMADGFTPHEQELYDAAKKENGVTWYTSQFTSEDADGTCKMFMARYEGVSCSPVRAAGGATFQRVMQEIQAKFVQGDVFSTNSLADLEELKKLGALEAYKQENLPAMTASLATLNDPDGYYFISGISPLGIVYNTDKVSPADVPKGWADLLDPKWKDQVAIGHPAFSGSSGLWTMAMEKTFGWDYFTKLAENNPQIGRSIADGLTLVISGERQLAVTAISLSLDGAAAGKPIGTVIPEEGLMLPPSGTGILAGTKNENSAKLFTEFLLSEEFSQWFADNRRIPLRDGFKTMEGVPDLSKVKTISIPIADAMAGLEAVKEKFRNTFGI